MEHLGPYELIEELRPANSGKIFVARDLETGKEVCVKTIKTADTHPELIERFYQEARVCGRLNHPYVVSVLRLGEQQGVTFIAMERLVGYDLRDFISRREALTLEDKIEIMVRICEGLDHAHREGIIHRDIKPSNIFLDETFNPKILDFGVARVQGSTLTEIGKPIGTPNYMAPEQLNGQEVTAQSDIFGLAIVFFEFLTWTHPFASANTSSKLTNSPPRRLRDIDPYMPEGLELILVKGLAADPAGRFASAAQFATALRELQASMEVETETMHRSALALHERVSQILYKTAPYLKRENIRNRIKNIDISAVDRLGQELTDPGGLHYLQLARIDEELRLIAGPVEQLGEYVDEVERRIDLTPPPSRIETTPPPRTTPPPVQRVPEPQPQSQSRTAPSRPTRRVDDERKAPNRWPLMLAGLLLFGIVVVALWFLNPFASKPIGQATSLKATSMSSNPEGGGSLTSVRSGADLKLLAPIPTAAVPGEWNLKQRIQVRTPDGATGWLALADLSGVSTSDTAFNEWFARAIRPSVSAKVIGQAKSSTATNLSSGPEGGESNVAVTSGTRLDILEPLPSPAVGPGEWDLKQRIQVRTPDGSTGWMALADLSGVSVNDDSSFTIWYDRATTVVPSVGQAKSSKATTLSSDSEGGGSLVPVPSGADLQLLAPIPVPAIGTGKWDLKQRIQARTTDGATGWLTLGDLAKVATNDRTFDVWHLKATGNPPPPPPPPPPPNNLLRDAQEALQKKNCSLATDLANKVLRGLKEEFGSLDALKRPEYARAKEIIATADDPANCGNQED